MLRGQFSRNYRKKGTGTPVFVYKVTGTDDELAEYELNQDSNLRKDEEDGSPLFFTTRYTGDNINIVKTQSDRYVADTQELEKAASMVSAYGGNLGDALASQFAAKIAGNIRSTPAATPVPKKESEKID